MELLEMRGIVKDFPGVRADDHVDFIVREGEIHALLGENGAGKTTLMNILYGLYKPDDGDIYWQGKKRIISSPSEAIGLGIGMVHQHFMLIKKMTVLQNILLGLRPEGYPFMREAAIAKQVQALSEKYGLTVNVHKRIEELSVGEQQRVEILKALYRNALLLILDEPTSALTPQETAEFFNILRVLRAEGHGIILISHNLMEILDISDRVTVLRDGKNVCTVETPHTTDKELSRSMIGRNLSEAGYQRDQATDNECVLKAEHISLNGTGDKRLLSDITLSVDKNEILGIAGVDGNGQLELAEVIMGIRRPSAGHILFYGETVEKLTIRARSEKGIAYIPSDRHQDGLIMDASVSENLHLRDFYKPPNTKNKIMDFKRMEADSRQTIERYNVKTPNTSVKVRSLSGGNQQKLILARELNTAAALIIACQPTRGLDIGATEYLREQLMQCRNRGGSVLLISTDLSEILAMSDRIAVMFEGRVMGIVKNDEALSVEMLGLMMGGQKLGEVETICAKS